MRAPIGWLVAAALALGTPPVLSALGCGGSQSMADSTPRMPPPPDSCITDFDCDVVDDCCRCDSGGRQIAIRKDAVADFMVERDQRCAGAMCPLMTSNDASCNADLKCGSYGRCRLIPRTRMM
jgi:hypothetical protein